MKEKGSVKDFFSRLKADYAFRTFFFAVCSLFVTLVFAGYNVFLSVAYRAAWNIGIAVYYILLVGIRSFVLTAERRVPKGGKRGKIYLMQSAMLFVIDLALIAPISLMVLQKKDVNYTIIPAIAMAAYTVYKISIGIYNYVKTKKLKDVGVRMLKTVNLMDALVSVLTLQYTLIMAVDGSIDGEMFTLSAITSFAIWALLIVISVISLVRAVKYQKSEGENETGDRSGGDLL